MWKAIYQLVTPPHLRLRISRAAAAYHRNDSAPESHQRWLQDDGPLKLLDFPLTAEDFVIDVGAYKGQWVADMFTRYQCTIAAVEPITEFSHELESKYGINSKIHLHPMALGAADRTEIIKVQGDASSLHIGEGIGTEINIRDVSSWLDECAPTTIALMAINCEGGEYEIVPRLIETGSISRIQRILIQFHQIGVGSDLDRKAIRSKLSLTHREVYSYPFIWELWEVL